MHSNSYEHKHPRMNYTSNDTPIYYAPRLLCYCGCSCSHCCCCCCCCRRHHHRCCCRYTISLSLSFILSFSHISQFRSIYLCASIHFSITLLCVSLWASKWLMYVHANTILVVREKHETRYRHIVYFVVFMHIQKWN